MICKEIVNEIKPWFSKIEKGWENLDGRKIRAWRIVTHASHA